MTLKQRFLQAIIEGQIGQQDKQGIIITQKEFTAYFKNIKPTYSKTFLATAVIETGLTHTRFLFRESKGIYRVHPLAIEALKQTTHNEQTQQDYEYQKRLIFNRGF